MNTKFTFSLFALACAQALPALAAGDCGPDPEPEEQVKMILKMPLERCQKDLPELRKIHDRIRRSRMSREQGAAYLAYIGIGLCNESKKLSQSGAPNPPPLPTPPEPCSIVHLAIEDHCAKKDEIEKACKNSQYGYDESMNQSISDEPASTHPESTHSESDISGTK